MIREMENSGLTKITYVNYGFTQTWSVKFNDPNLEDILQGFIGCLIGSGWQQKQIIDVLDTYVYEHKQ